MSEHPQSPRLRHRLFACIALFALLGGVATLGYLLISNLVRLPFALLALIVAVVAGWTALTNRGARRVIGLAVAVLALAGAVVLLGLSTLAGGVLVVALVIASMVAARAAIGRHRPQNFPADPAPETTPVARAARPVMLFNPRSGGGVVQKSGLVAKAARRGISCVILGDGDDLRAIAEREIAEGATALGMAGGDGSQALVADVARRHDVAFVCVPAGTRNHFAQDLGVDRRNVVAALDAFGEAVERRVDLASVNGHIFVNNASMGVYAAIVQSDDYRASKLSTAVAMLPDLVGPDSPPFDLQFEGPDGTRHESTDLLMVSNNPYAVATPVGLGSRPRLDAGELGILAVRAQRGGAAAPNQERNPVLAWTATGFRVDSAQPIAVGLDGEALLFDAPLEFATLPRALRVRLARNVVAPAAAGPAPGVRATALALARIIAGREPWPGPGKA